MFWPSPKCTAARCWVEANFIIFRPQKHHAYDRKLFWVALSAGEWSQRFSGRTKEELYKNIYQRHHAVMLDYYQRRRAARNKRHHIDQQLLFALYW